MSKHFCVHGISPFPSFGLLEWMPGNDVGSKGPSFVLKFGVRKFFLAGLETPAAEFDPGGRVVGKWVRDGARSLCQPLPQEHTHLPGLGPERTHLRPDDLIKRARLGGSVQGKRQGLGPFCPGVGFWVWGRWGSGDRVCGSSWGIAWVLAATEHGSPCRAGCGRPGFHSLT